MRRNNPYTWWNLLFFLGVLAVNALSVTLPLGGNSTGEIPLLSPDFLYGTAFSG
ncbi:hypothetical protein [Paenibacillus sonchi]|uniref:hypothetical protein n=1 Tax=Paenibacillus sonchi TaxID=373687 RepID=UPI001E2B3A0E|nr:hypothetical protein [Paenibacillus sonchi]